MTLMDALYLAAYVGIGSIIAYVWQVILYWDIHHGGNHERTHKAH